MEKDIKFDKQCDHLKERCKGDNSYFCDIRKEDCIGREESESNTVPYFFNPNKAKELCPELNLILKSLNSGRKIYSELLDYINSLNKDKIEIRESGFLKLQDVTNSLERLVKEDTPENIVLVISKCHKNEKYMTKIYTGE